MDYLHDLNAFLPGVIIALAGIIAIVIDAYKNDHGAIFGVSVFSLIAGLAVSVMEMFGLVGEALSGMIAYRGVGGCG